MNTVIDKFEKKHRDLTSDLALLSFGTLNDEAGDLLLSTHAESDVCDLFSQIVTVNTSGHAADLEMLGVTLTFDLEFEATSLTLSLIYSSEQEPGSVSTAVTCHKTHDGLYKVYCDMAILSYEENFPPPV